MTTDTAPNRRLIKWFIGTAIFTFTVLLHVTFPNIGGSGLQMPSNSAVWLGFALMMAIAMWPATRGVIRYSKFHIGLGLLLLALWLPFIWSWNEASLIALPRMFTVTAGAILLLGLAQLQPTCRDWYWLGMAILLGVLLEAIYAIVQYYLLGPGLWLSYDPEYGRPFGVFQQPNVLATFLTTGLVISARLMRDLRSRPLTVLASFAPLLIPLPVFLTYSRIGWLSFLIIVPILLVYLFLTGRRQFIIWAGLLIIGILIAYVGLINIETSPRDPTSTNTVNLRIGKILHSINMIMDKPVTGWGYGRFQHDFINSLAEARASDAGVNLVITTNLSHPHNELLLWGIEGGLLPMTAMLCMGIYVMYRVFFSKLGKERIILFCLPLPLLLHSMTELPFYHSTTHFLTFVLLLGFIVAVAEKTSTRDFRYTFSIKIGAFFATPLLLLFFATHLHTLFKIADYAYKITESRDPLGDIINPFGMYRQLEFLQMSRQVNAGVAIGFTRAAEDYIHWAEESKRLVPRPELYYNLILAYRALEDDAAVKRVESEAEWLYPTFRSMYKNKREDHAEAMEEISSSISRP
ncbi:O-antigen polymerase [Halomonas fontilapidosi]|uniref:O-antigen polymerase n=1 Tax=Halomonas fontilapidosi TaxID=616675 RepID=A0A7W5DMT8_9GAMM|nr:Wzy polymerase domain-containing protein [Halomonas fontilapidosi]MBB3185626.1 O-antigen polymerase [Halomonas fontilapidosi]